MPCNYTEMKRVLEADPSCPMCDKTLEPMEIVIASDPEAEFKALIELMRDSGPSKDEEEEGDGADENA